MPLPLAGVLQRLPAYSSTSFLIPAAYAGDKEKPIMSNSNKHEVFIVRSLFHKTAKRFHVAFQNSTLSKELSENIWYFYEQ